MSSTTPTPNPGPPLGEKYQAAIALLTAESSVFWSLTQTFLLAETLLAGFLVQAIAPGGQSAPPSEKTFQIAGAALGVIVSILWISATRRISGYCTRRVEQARALELSDPLGLLTSGSITKGTSTKKSAMVLASLFLVFFMLLLLFVVFR